ncbi:hypothetical protein C4K88_03890 [Arthrobacter pityocampae]|uniref:Uncharacterized protein n=2 Tax=Arthrobacter pityocampae TaxID=547334 RepID=A0A2S5IZ69_9MICC|nr:hypothetical protein C4K88_03890 [Arthrobacter pityocampae]
MGTLIGLVGACVFVFSYTPGFSDPASVAARLLVIATVSTTLWFLFAAPRFLGPFIPPRRAHVGVYVLCVVLEFALIAAGSRWLGTTGRLELRPTLIAFVVGLHFLPFAWAFKERMFYTLGGLLVGLGALGLLIGTQASALGAAVTSGLIMAFILLTYSLGLFAPRRRTENI